MVSNPNKYSEMGTGTSLNDIRDDDDFPHVGLIKALADGIGQNYAINGFNASSISATSVVIAAGNILRDGKLFPVTGATLTIAAANSGTGHTYSLLVCPTGGSVASPPTVVRRQGTVKGKTPSITAGDTIIGILVHTGSSPMQIQYLTVNKPENNVSIGYSNSGTFAQVGTLEGLAGGTTLDSTVGALTLTSDNDVTVKLGGTDATDVFAVTDNANSPETQFSVTGAGVVNIPSLTASEIVITDSSKNVVSAAVGTYPSLAELIHVKGVSSAIQTQIGGLYSRSGGPITGDIDVYKAITSTTNHTTTAIEVDVDTTAAIANGQTGNNKGIIVDVNASGDVNGNGANVVHAGTVVNTGIDISVVGDASESGTDKNIGLNVSVSDADTLYSAIFNGGNVGIGTSTPAAPLHVISIDDGATLLLESTDAGAGLAPDLIFKRTSSSPATGDNLGSIRFLGTNVNDSGSGVGGDDSAQKAEHEFADIYARANDVTLGTEDGELYFRTFLAGTQKRRLDLTPTEAVFNEDSQDINFRVESDDSTHMLYIDAGNNKIGIKANNPASTLDVGGNARIVSPSDAAGTALIVDNADTDQQAIHIEAANITANVLDITADTLTTHNALDISSTGLTTGKGINLISSSVPADGATHVANAIVTANTSVNTQTVTGLLFNYNKTGETASGKTATVTGIHLDMDDDANHASGTVLMTGLDIDVTSATTAGTLTNTGLNVAVGGADTNYAALFSGGNVGIGTGTPANKLQISHTGADGNNGLMIVREDASTADGDLLGGIGFDSTDGNVPSSVLESSAFIASIATEAHTTTDKGGNLKFGVSLIDEDDDVVSTVLASVGPPDTIANATCHAGFNSRATTAIVAAATYAPTIGDSGTLVIFEHANSNLTLPSINNTTSVGVQFTVFNETGSAINAQIAVSNSATVNGGAIAALDDIASFKAATFVCSGNNTWIRIG